MSDSKITTTKNDEVSDRSNQKRINRAMQPPVDIVEDAAGITMWVDLPGVPKDKLDLQVHDANLYIEAEAQIATDENFSLHHAELHTPRFARSFKLSADFDCDKIDANLNDGVLKVVIPRHEKARPRRIEVRVN
jgi:HSP20 family molecular chaperone IbpA